MDGDAALTNPATDPLASDVVAACEDAWRTIQSNHPDLPDVVMLLGSGVERGRLVKLGHWWGSRWLADGGVRGEVLLAGEALHLDPETVFEVLLHEAAHGLNASRGIKDTSRGGRYHNARFKSTAHDVGLTVEQMDPYGFAKTELRSETADRYADEIARLASTMRIARRLPAVTAAQGEASGVDIEDQTSGSGERGGREKVKPAECGCGRRMRMAPTVLAQGPVICALCNADFLVDREASNERGNHDRVPTDFASRRTAQLRDAEAIHPHPEVLSEVATTADGVDDLLRLGSWRGSLNTDAEHPIAITDERERDRWDSLARAALMLDGSLHGPALAARDGLELRAGDQVIVAKPIGITPLNLPDEGALGVVVLVDPVADTATIDFATAGRFTVRSATDEAAVLAYSYCELSRLIQPTPAAAPTTGRILHSVPDIEPDIDLGIER